MAKSVFAATLILTVGVGGGAYPFLPRQLSLAAAFTLGYKGFIVGPPMIGILSDQVGLPKTFVVLMVAALTVAALGARATATKAVDHPSDLALPGAAVDSRAG